METDYADPSASSLLLLKQRIIKVEALLKKYACLTKKFNELEKSHSQIVEKEKNAKKDAAKYLEKYCILSKKCKSMVAKVKELEEALNEKTRILQNYKNECAELDSVIGIYKIERVKYENWNRDKEFLLSLTWKLLRHCQEHKDITLRSTTDSFFQRFEKDIEELKLTDFRNHKQNNSKSLPGELGSTLVSSELPVIGSVKSDFIGADFPPALVKSSASDESNVFGEKHKNVRREIVNDSYQNQMESVPDSDIPLAERYFKGEQNKNKEISRHLDKSCESNSDLLHTKSETLSSGTCSTRKNIKPAACPSVSHMEINEIGKSHHSQTMDNREHDKIDSNLTWLSTFSGQPTGTNKPDITNQPVEFGRECGKKHHTFPNNFRNPKTKVQGIRTFLTNKKYQRKTLHMIPDVHFHYERLWEANQSDIDCVEHSKETVSLNMDDIFGDLKIIPDINYSQETVMNYSIGPKEIMKEYSFNSEGSSSLLFVEENDLEHHFPKGILGRSRNENSQDLLLLHTQEKLTTRNCTEKLSDIPSKLETNINLSRESTEDINCKHGEGDGKYDVPNVNSFSNETKNLNNERTHALSSFKADVEYSKIGCEGNKPLTESHILQSVNEITDEEVSAILKNVKNVRLISPLKEKPHNGNSRPNHVTPNLKKDPEVQKNVTNFTSSKNLANKSRCGMRFDASVQTDAVVNVNVSIQTSGEKRHRSTSATVNSIEDIFSKMWNKKLKKNFRTLDCCTKILKNHTCCFLFFKILLRMIGVNNLNSEKCKKNINNHSVDRSEFLELVSKNKSKSLRKREYSWHVEDMKATDMGSSESQAILDCSKQKPNNFATEFLGFKPLPENLVGMLGAQQIENKPFDWFHSKTFDPEEQQGRECDSNGCTSRRGRITKAGSPPEHKILCSFKEEIESCTNLRKSSFIFDQFMDKTDSLLKDESPTALEIKKDSGVVRKISFNENSTVKPENSDQNKEECCETKMTAETCGEEEDIVLAPRRSPRIQNKNLMMNVRNICEDFDVQTSDLTSLMQSNEIVTGDTSIIKPGTCDLSDSLTSTSNEHCDKVVNKPFESCKTLKQKYDFLFGETEIQETEEPKRVCKDIDSQKKTENVLWNLRSKTFSTSCSRNDYSPVHKRRKLSCRSFYDKPAEIDKMRLTTEPLYSCPTPREEDGKNDDRTRCTVKTSDSEVGLVKGEDCNNFLDSIMTAMTKQTEEFKTKVHLSALDDKNINELNTESLVFDTYKSGPRNIQPSDGRTGLCSSSVDNSFYKESPESRVTGTGNCIAKKCDEPKNVLSRKYQSGKKMKDLVEAEIQKFLTLEMKTVEEAEEKIRPCISVLEKASEDVIANAIVAEVLTNVDEELQDFDRPAPPLTQTQHRLMTIITIISNSHERFNRIAYTILKVISMKIFPEKFFWPDDSLEMCARFYTSLCKKLNNVKEIWKFCFKAVTLMRQRWCIPVLVVFQVWPDVLHNANEINDNILANTFVNVILHTPKMEGLRKKRQEKKLLAVKTLLIRFYKFEVNLTIEEFTRNLYESLLADKPGCTDALVFLARSRAWLWTKKYIISRLLGTITNWLDGKIQDNIGHKILDIICQINWILPIEDDHESPSVKDIISVLYRLLSSPKLNRTSQEKTIRTLCSLAHHSGVVDILTAYLNKFPDNSSIQLEINRAIRSSNNKRKQIIKNFEYKKKIEWKAKTKKTGTKKRAKRKKKSKATSPNNVFDLSKESGKVNGVKNI